MADEETHHSDSSTTASPGQQNEDDGAQQFTAYQNRPVRTAPVPSQAQTAASLPSSPQTVDFLKNLSTEQLLSSSKGNGLAQASNASAHRSFQNRHATQPPPTYGHAVRGRIDPSVSASARAASSPLAYPTQTALVPPQDQNADFLPSSAQTAHPSSLLAPETPCLSQDLNRTRPRDGSKCPVCRMDLTPHQSISRMACGHRFHTLCLNLSPTALPGLPHVLLRPCPICGRRWR